MSIYICLRGFCVAFDEISCDEDQLVMLRVFDTFQGKACVSNGFAPWIEVDYELAAGGCSNRNEPVDLVKSEKVFEAWEGLSINEPVEIE